jgi:molybdopterin/thiamine biosynthesis adenylyltransferase
MKQVFPWFPIEDKIFVQRCGSVLEIDDSSGMARRLFGLLDGTRTCADVHRELAAEFPDVTLDDIEATVTQLDAALIVEDGAAPLPDDPYVVGRALRDLGFLETYSSLAVSKYELHRRIRECRVAVLGAGGVGSHVLYDLLGLGIQDLRVVDFDTVELSNLNRQILYRESEIGRLKTELVVDRAREYAPRARVETVQLRISSADDAYRVVADRDIVVVTTDQPKMSIVRWVGEGCVRAGATMLCGGVDMQRSMFYTIIPGRTGCVECWRRQSSERDELSARVSAELIRIEQGMALGERFGQDLAAFGPLVTCHTASVVTELVRLATGIVPPVAAGRSMEVRFDDFTVREVERWERLPECPVCGDGSDLDERVAVGVTAAVKT